jgi:hypothetical protein
MTACDDFIEKISKALPDPALPADLVSVGLYPSVQCAYYARTVHNSPEYFSIGKKVFYPKQAVLEWLKACKRDDGTFTNCKKESSKSL